MDIAQQLSEMFDVEKQQESEVQQKETFLTKEEYSEIKNLMSQPNLSPDRKNEIRKIIADKIAAKLKIQEQEAAQEMQDDYYDEEDPEGEFEQVQVQLPPKNPGEEPRTIYMYREKYEEETDQQKAVN